MTLNCTNMTHDFHNRFQVHDYVIDINLSNMYMRTLQDNLQSDFLYITFNQEHLLFERIVMPRLNGLTSPSKSA